MNVAAVAEAIEKVHMQSEPIFSYKDENSLSCVLNLAYYGAKDFCNVIREMLMGKGIRGFCICSEEKLECTCDDYGTEIWEISRRCTCPDQGTELHGGAVGLSG